MDVDSQESLTIPASGEEVHAETQQATMETDGQANTVLSNGGDTVSAQGGTDDKLEDDECRSEGVVRHRIEQFSKFKESSLSVSILVRNVPWKILAMPKQHMVENRQAVRALGFFIQCNGDCDTPGWSCFAMAELRIIAQKPGCDNVVKRVSHVFHPKENDWGYANFLSFSEITDPNRGLVKDDTVILEAFVQADPPHGVQWDSKKLTGFVGLRNQGATCYMNSLLQTLFFTNRLRNAVYQMPTDNDDPQRSVPFALQRVFYDLQFSDKPVGTKKLTRSFGWETLDSFMQHDVQELCRVLLDNLESKMKGTCVEGTIASLFEGKMESYIRCKKVDYTSARVEKFYDVQLNVKGKNTVYESFDDYVAVELLDGDNKYDAGGFGLQEAEKGVIFLQFPPVLHLQLMRFQYDPNLDVNVKINDRFEFAERLDLSRYLKPQTASQSPQSPIYLLQAVLVHSGDNHGGHYVVYISPHCDGKWFRFDDDVVSRSTRQEATVNNYGGSDEDFHVRSSSNAYMLVYVNEAKKDFVIENILEENIPETLRMRLEEEKRIEQRRKKERQEAHLYMDVTVFTRETFETNHGYDLFEQDRLDLDKRFSVRKTSTLRELIQRLAVSFGLPPSALRVWPIVQNEQTAYRPSPINRRVLAAHKNVYEDVLVSELVDSNEAMLYIWLEIGELAKASEPLPVCSRDHVLLFLKRYETFESQNYYSGHAILPLQTRVSDLSSLCCERARYPADTALRFWLETAHFAVQPLADASERTTLADWITELNRTYAESSRASETRQQPIVISHDFGFVVVFQKTTHDTLDAEAGQLSTVRDFYLKDLSQRIRVAFHDKTLPNDPGFVLELNARWNYDQMCKAVARHLSVDPYKLSFSRSVRPDQPVKLNFEGSLRDLFQIKERFPAMPNSTQNRNVRRLFYQLLSVRINELENKYQIKCTWVSSKLKEEKELILYPDRGGLVRDLLNEARRHVELAERGSGILRLLEVVSCRIHAYIPEDVHLEKLLNNSESHIPRMLRVEEVPVDEVSSPHSGDNELIITCAHFQKDTFSTFGVPFTVKLKHGDIFTQIRERIQKKLDLAEREIEKWRFCIVHNTRVQYVEPNEQETYTVNLHEMKALVKLGWLDPQRVWLGLDHVNKQQRRTRYSYLEKSIKIHN